MAAQHDLLIAGPLTICGRQCVGQETSPSGKEMWLHCVCAQAVVWPHTSAVLPAALVGKHQLCRHQHWLSSVDCLPRKG